MRTLAEIAATIEVRNSLRQEFGMVTIPVEQVAAIQAAELRADFRRWCNTSATARAIEQELLAEVCGERSDDSWLPRAYLNGAAQFGHRLQQRWWSAFVRTS